MPTTTDSIVYNFNLNVNYMDHAYNPATHHAHSRSRTDLATADVEIDIDTSGASAGDGADGWGYGNDDALLHSNIDEEAFLKSDTLYREQILEVFGLDKHGAYDEAHINQQVGMLFEICKRNHHMMDLVQLAVESNPMCMFVCESDRNETGFMTLFAYDYFYLTHQCIRYILKSMGLEGDDNDDSGDGCGGGGDISEATLNSLMASSSSVPNKCFVELRECMMKNTSVGMGGGMNTTVGNMPTYHM